MTFVRFSLPKEKSEEAILAMNAFYIDCAQDLFTSLDASEDGFVTVAEAPWSVAEWAVAPRFDKPRATALVLLLG